MSRLFTPLKLRSEEFKNRIFVSPMCQYSSDDGIMANMLIQANAVADTLDTVTNICSVNRPAALGLGLCGKIDPVDVLLFIYSDNFA